MMSSFFVAVIAGICLANGQRGKSRTTTVQPSQSTTPMIGTTTEGGAHGVCYEVTGFNNGVVNEDKCGPSGSTGLRYCALTDECVRGPTCPECDYSDELGFIRWHKGEQACCDTLATVVENCTLTYFTTGPCIFPGGFSFSRNYSAICPNKCGNQTLVTGTFGREPCSLNDWNVKDMDKQWTLLVTPCEHGEFAFLDDAYIVSIKLISVFIGIFYVFLY